MSLRAFSPKVCIFGDKFDGLCVYSKFSNIRISNIHRIYNKYPHSNAKIHSIQILDVRQAAFYVAHKMRLRCRCRCILMLFLAYPVEPTGRGASHSKYFRKKRTSVWRR